MARIGQLKTEAPDARECAGLLRSAVVRLRDAQQATLSIESRYLVFQCLEHTLAWKPVQWLLLDQAHRKRNLAEYEGELDVTESFVLELIGHAAALIAATQALDLR